MSEHEWIEPTSGSTLAFALIVAAVVSMLIAGVGYAWREDRPGRKVGVAVLAIAAWMGVTGAYVAAGMTARGGPFLVGFFVVLNLAAIATAFSPAGTRLARTLPFAALIGFHWFRLPLELVLHRWAELRTVPVQMTYSGHNFDIVSGILATALGLYALVRREDLSARVFFVANLVSTALLVAVIVIVILSSPLPIHAYPGPPLLLALHLPYAYIGTVCVVAALFVHLVGWRAYFARR